MLPLLLSAEHSSACCLQELISLKGEQEDGQAPVQVLPCHTQTGFWSPQGLLGMGYGLLADSVSCY